MNPPLTLSLENEPLHHVEVPVEIQDFSCSNSFESNVKLIEQFLVKILQGKEEVRNLFSRRGEALVATTPSISESGSADEAPDDRTKDEILSGDSPQVFSESVELIGVGGSVGGNSRHASPGAVFPSSQREDSNNRAVIVELHLFDTHHPVAQQYCLPSFLLIKKVTVNTSYHIGETNYLISLLSTAVGNVMLREQLFLVIPGTTATSARSSNMLPSPFSLTAGCIPCFAPIGDPYQQSYTGLTPPLPMPVHDHPPHLTPAERVLLHQQSFLSTFTSNAYGRPPPGCQTISELLDLFQLHVGQRSRISGDDFEGICISIRKEYHLKVPWRFPATGLSSDCTRMTWTAIMERENTATQLLCGPWTHPFGTAQPPLLYLRLRAQWNQLQDVEAVEADKRGYLSLFKTPPPPTAARGAQRKCTITVQAVVRGEEQLDHAAAKTLQSRVLTPYLEWVRHANTTVPNRQDAGLSQATTPRRGRGGSAEDRESEADEGGSDTRLSEVWTGQLVDMVVGAGIHASVLQDALLSNFSEEPVDIATLGAGRSATMADRLQSLWQRMASQQGGSGMSPKGGSPVASVGKRASHKDLRSAYFPESFFSRFAYVCASHVPNPSDVQVLWQACVLRIKRLFDNGRMESLKSLLACLAMPQRSPAVDLGNSLLIQKLHLLHYCVQALIEKHSGGTGGKVVRNRDGTVSPSGASLCSPRREADGWDDVDAGGADDYEETTLSVSATSKGIPPDVSALDAVPSIFGPTASVLHLITNKEVMVIPPVIPPPPLTSDLILQRAAELNALGASAVAHATRAWLQSDALYNDMCVFLYVNKASEGHVVRFPDFIHWHSPRDFCLPPPDLLVDSSALSDNDYLSERMQKLEDSTSHVWWSLWNRAVPRSPEDVIRSSFHPHEQAVLALRWLGDLSECDLLVEVVNASIANALHRLLTHRMVLGDGPANTTDQASSGGWPPSTATTREPRKQCIPALSAYVRQRCTSLTREVEGASSLYYSTFRSGEEGCAVVDGSEMELIFNMYGTAIAQLNEIETSICTAIAVHYLLRCHSEVDSEDVATARALSSPAAAADNSSSSLILQAHTLHPTSWRSCFAHYLTHPDDQEEQEVMMRLTCMAERPLGTSSCFQQLVVLQDVSQSLRLALILSREVL